jgi:hypothetical protein
MNKIFERFTCIHTTSTRYHLKELQRCFKALQTSLKTSLRIDEEGMMALQCLFPKKVEQVLNPYVDAIGSTNQTTDPESKGFVELKLSPVFMEESED